VSATDHATPDQTNTHSITVLRLASTGDSDGDGLSDLMEYALGLDPLVANSTGTPTAALQVNSADGLSFLTLTYRRRLTRNGLTYHIETSPDLKTWTEISSPEKISASANGDSLTETVVVRLLPSIDATTPRRFARLKVTTP
jgi:hypothetical protein